MENVTTLLKLAEELSQKVYQQEERLKKLIISADDIIASNNPESALYVSLLFMFHCLYISNRALCRNSLYQPSSIVERKRL